MCGIYFCYGDHESKKHSCLKNRGPDETKLVKDDKIFAAFYRLAIVGIADGMQPFIHQDTMLLCNGEIYNYKQLEKKYNLLVKTKSDCECILHLYEKYGIEKTVCLLEGEFAFILYDSNKKLIHFIRDRLGRKPLFYSITGDNIDICSLYSGLEFDTKEQVVPRFIYTYNIGAKVLTKQQYHAFIYKPSNVSNIDLFALFVEAVKKRVIQSERPVGFLLSGGFDSSLVLSTALEFISMKEPPHAFTIGFSEHAPDVKSAELMVNFLRTKHGHNCIKWHKIILPIEDGLKAVHDVIKALETYDTTTIRASTPMYLLSQYIAKNTNVRVLLSGEGSDELFGGYLYFKYAPDDQAFRAEIIDRLNELYLYDVLRADRATAEHGLEIRTPFLDDPFVEATLQSLNLVKCVKNTKELIRKCVESKGLLPDEILYGKKEAFSDAVGFSWKKSLSIEAEKFCMSLNILQNGEFNNSKFVKELSPYVVPETPEMIYFQMIFNNIFKNSWHVLPHLWLPNQNWVKTGVEPSATILPNYGDSVNFEMQRPVESQTGATAYY
jgi:asparagine synthase (glutamine-hydrolysing)